MNKEEAVIYFPTWYLAISDVINFNEDATTWSALYREVISDDVLCPKKYNIF